MSFLWIISVLGCSDVSLGELQAEETESEVWRIPENSNEDTENITDICLDLYRKAAEENMTDDLETIRSIINRLGENGYPAVDSRNQIDMVCAKQVVRFCEMVEAQEEAEITILKVDYFGGFVQYDLTAKDGNVDVVRSDYKYEHEKMQREETGSYQAEHWNYTEDGYLMFFGSWFSEELYVLTLSEAEEYTALRVRPLDDTCRELNRKYLLPVSYERNNLFLTDWSEEDFGELNFYDAYDIFYPLIMVTNVPYTAEEDLGVGAIYRIPKDEFESVIMAYFDIDSETLQSKTIYDPEDAVYEYRPRGLDEVEYPQYPYPEVVGFTENGDGTMTLTVHVVFPYSYDSKVYAHEVVIRPFEDGRVQYVSNRIIPSQDNREETWHTPRLNGEEWEKQFQRVKRVGMFIPVFEQ